MAAFIARALARFCHNRPARLIDTGGEPYLYRIFLFSWRGWNCYLHRFVSPDAERWLHDHPFHGISFVLLGGYDEERLHQLAWPSLLTRVRRVRFFNWIPGDRFHRILQPKPNTWTLFLHGPKYKGWGFLEPEHLFIRYHNPFGNVGDKPWWETALTYGQLMLAAEAARTRVSREEAQQMINSARAAMHAAIADVRTAGDTQ